MNVDISFFVEYAEVTRAHPSVFCEDGFRRLFVLVITLHDVDTLNLNLAVFACRVFGIDTNAALRQFFSATMEGIIEPVFITDQWTAFRHSVTYTVLVFDVMQYLLHFAVEGSSADDEVPQSAAEGLVQAFFYFAADDILEYRRLPHNLGCRTADLRKHTLLDDFLNNQRHGKNHERLHLREGFHQHRRGRSLGQEEDLGTVAYLIEELEHQSEHVRNRQHGENSIARFVGNTLAGELNVAAQVQVCQHYAFRVSCRAGGVIDYG